MKKAVIVNAKRTVIGKKDGILKQYSPEKLAAMVLRDLTKDLSVPADDIILGNVVGPGGNLARLASLDQAGKKAPPGLTIDRQCGSGLEAIRLACHLIQGGAGDIFIAGGVESTSRSPMTKRAQFSPLAIGDPDMGPAADNAAQKYGITRAMQDEYALLSYERAINAYRQGLFTDEIIEDANLPQQDEGINLNMNYKRLLQRLSPCFVEGGTITLGNCCGINDGAAGLLIMSEEMARKLAYTPVLRFVESAIVQVDPNYPITGAVEAIKAVLKKCDLTVDDICRFELNEAFAAKAVLVSQELSIPYEKINMDGGAIALGHPYSASGAILVTRLFYATKRVPLKYSLAVIGVGGGLGVAIVWESC